MQSKTLIAFVGAARLRTLPLAIAVISMGDICARLFVEHRIEVSIWVLITTLLLQILSNFANDYGDFKKGTDTIAQRKDRALASGVLSEKQVLTSIIITSLLALFSGINLLRVSFQGDFSQGFAFMLLLGLLSILAAITYTVGRNAYGYKALGDFFVFLFFGPVAIYGCVFLHSPDIFFSISSSAMYSITFASLCMGFATTSVLNINNIRDIEKDKAAKKITLPVLLGFRKAKIYHLLLVSSMLLSFVLFGLYAGKSLQVVVVMFLLSALVFNYRTYKVFVSKPDTPFLYFNKELKLFSLSVLILPILACL